MEFTICAHELRSFEIKVEADTLKDAIKKVEDDPSVFVDGETGEYVDGSFEVAVDATECINELDFIKDMLGHDWMAETSDDEGVRIDEIKGRHHLKQLSAGSSIGERIYNDLALHGYSDEEIKRWNEQRKLYKRAYEIV
jgi:hypothetical protein